MSNDDLTRIDPVFQGITVMQEPEEGPLSKLLSLFDKFMVLQLVLRHHVFNENEAAAYCRCSRESIHYHATRSRKLTFLKFSKEGLIFLKKDLDTFLDNARVEGFRDLS
ncbi:hypothetical protein WDW37_08040 [Bdellovibrionota bacterium FG-1]